MTLLIQLLTVIHPVLQLRRRLVLRRLVHRVPPQMQLVRRVPVLVRLPARLPKKVVALAKELATENIPYVWGGESLKGMDCSGLTDYVYQHAAGITLGHYTVTQESKVTKEAVSDAQAGDLLFWGKQGASYHVAIYIGNNQYVAAPEPGENVQVQTISSYFKPSFAGKVNS